MAAEELLNLSASSAEESITRLRLTLNLVSDEYVALLRREHCDDAWPLLERLAAQWRRTAEQDGFERLDEPFLPADAIELAAALESSLALAGADGVEDHLLQGDEVLRRISAVGATGIWPGWERTLDVAWREREHTAGRPESDRPDDWPPAPAPIKRPRRSNRRTLGRLDEAMGETLLTAVQGYYDADPQGRPLGSRHRQALRGQVIDVARISRQIDEAARAYSATDWDHALIMRGTLQSVARSAVLALSDDHTLRQLAMPATEVHWRLSVMDARLRGASPEQAFGRLSSDGAQG